MSAEVPEIPLPRGKAGTALRLPTSPSAAFRNFNDPFETKSSRNIIKNTEKFVPMMSELAEKNFDVAFSSTDFRGPRGDFAKNVFNIKRKKTFGPQNLPRTRRRTARKNLALGIDF